MGGASARAALDGVADGRVELDGPACHKVGVCVPARAVEVELCQFERGEAHAEGRALKWRAGDGVAGGTGNVSSCAASQ